MKKCILGGFIFILSILVLVGCDSEATTSGESDGTVSKTKEMATYKVNEDIYITNDSSKYRLKITDVKETKERNKYSDTKADKVVVVSYEYENISSDSDLYISSMDFKAYDKENNSLETYEVIDYKYPTDISQGRKTNAEMVFALNSDSNYIELEYYDNVWNSSSDCKIILEW